MRRNSNRKALNAPYDLNDAITLFVFLIVVVSIIFFYDEANTLQKTSQPGDPQAILSKLVADSSGAGGMTALVVGDSIDSAFLNQLSNTNYNQLKSILGVKSEFVIYFEDENGNLVMLENKPCIGSSLASVNGHRCNE